MRRYWLSFVAAALIAIAAVAPATAQQEADASVELEEVDGSGYSGLAELHDEDGQTRVEINLERQNGAAEDEENGTVSAAIHEGTCEEPGDEAYSLEGFEDEYSESTVDAAFDELTGGDYVLALLTGEDGQGIVACGELTAAPATDDDETPTAEETPETTPEATPEETPEETPEATPEETPEETPEATPEETPEATPEETPDATPEVTPEETPEETPEATPEETPEPDDLAPATGGSGGSGYETAAIVFLLLAGGAIGTGFLIRRRAAQI